MKTEIFPEDVLTALNSYMKNPAASSCSDENLLRVLRKYDSKKNTSVHLEDMPVGSTFKYGKDRYFTKGARIRKRFTCYEVGTKRVYLFSPLAEVHLVAQPLFNES